MYNRLVIIGAGGHGKVIADMALKLGYTEISFLDDNNVGKCLNFPIIGTIGDSLALNDEKTDFVIAIGNNLIRKNIAEKYDVNWVTLVHPSAQIGLGVNLGEGNVVMAGAVINADAKIGNHCIINTCAVVEHDNQIDNYVHISPNATLGGTVTVGQATHIGIGAVVKNNIDICSDCIIGVGTAVVNNIDERGTYVGIPSRKIN